jgi:hypothetical protein
VLGGPVALGGHHHARTVLDGAFEQEDVRLLAGLEDAQLGVDGGAVCDHPVGSGLRAAAQRFDVVPRAPALVRRIGLGVGAEVEDERGVEVR